MEGCLCRLRQSVTYASPIAQQNSLGTWLECDEWNVRQNVSYAVINASHGRQTYLVASWSLLHRQNTKADLIQKLCMTLLSLAIPPFRGDGQMTKKCPKFIYEYREDISYPPPVLPLFGGDIAHLPILGGYWPILPSIMGKKWGDKSFMLLARIIYSPLPCGSIWSFFHGFRFIHLYPSYSCRSACQVLHEPNLSQLRASSKLIPTAWQQSSLSSSSDIQHIPRTIN